MDRRLVVGVLAALICPLAGRVAAANDQASPPTLEELLERLESLEQDKGRMQGEIDTLRAHLGENWLTEQRAEEIKSLVADVLADADSRASLVQDGLTAGWDDHFFLASPDDRFRLQIEGLMQFRYVWNYHNQADRYLAGFENTRTRLGLSGHVFNRDLTYGISGEFLRAGGFQNLFDAWIRYQLDENFSVRFGQFKIPFNREELVRPQHQLVVERSLINEAHNIGRSQGVALTYQTNANKLTFMVHDAATDNVGGFVGGTGQNTPALSPDTEFAIAARYERLVAGTWEQFRDFTSPPGEPFGLLLGIAGHWQKGEFGTPFAPFRDEDRWFGVAVDASAEYGGANWFGSVTYHYIDDVFAGQVHSLGLVVQAGAFFSPKFEAFARFEYGLIEFDVTELSDLYLLTLGGNYYFDGHDVKLTADIGFGVSQVEGLWPDDLPGWRTDADGAEPQVVIRIQFQLLF